MCKFNSHQTRFYLITLFALLLQSCSYSSFKETVSSKSDGWHYLLDEELSQWQIWLGVPHTSVKDLPYGTFQSKHIHQHGDIRHAIGLNNNLKNVFSVIEENGELVLKITGEIYGGLTSLASYENYHLSFQVKWGDKKWAPRLTKKRDSGLLFHCQGAHGAFWKTWKACQELQIQESDFGDYIPLAGPTGNITTNTLEKPIQYHPEGKISVQTSDYIHAHIEPDKPNGEWNVVDLYVLNDKALFVVNGELVMIVNQSQKANGEPLTSGQLQIQSEGAEVYYKEIKLKSITAEDFTHKLNLS